MYTRCCQGQNTEINIWYIIYIQPVFCAKCMHAIPSLNFGIACKVWVRCYFMSMTYSIFINCDFYLWVSDFCVSKPCLPSSSPITTHRLGWLCPDTKSDTWFTNYDIRCNHGNVGLKKYWNYAHDPNDSHTYVFNIYVNCCNGNFTVQVLFFTHMLLYCFVDTAPRSSCDRWIRHLVWWGR